MGYDDNRPTSRAVLVFRRKQKRSAISKEQNMAVFEIYDPLKETLTLRMNVNPGLKRLTRSG